LGHGAWKTDGAAFNPGDQMSGVPFYKRAFRACSNAVLSVFPDNLYYRFKYLFSTRQILHLKHPRSFNEKIQWIKCYDHNPLYTQCADKYAVREFVKERIGEEHLIPLFGVWERAEDIDFEKLPSQFVLKCNHDSGSVVICKDKAKLDLVATRKHLAGCLERDYYATTAREWAYQDIPRKIVAESLLQAENGNVPSDYKIYCFNGKPQYTLLITGRFQNVHESFYDAEWNLMPFSTGYAPTKIPESKPPQLNRLLEIAAQIAAGFPFTRIDLYVVKGKIYFGEMTWYPMGGYLPFKPKKYDLELGNLLQLPMEGKT
jgi:hypothetical protein